MPAIRLRARNRRERTLDSVMPRTEAISTLESSSKAESMQHLPLLGGQPVDAGEHMCVMLGCGGQLLGGKPCGGQHARQFVYVVGFGAGFGAALAVEDDVPDNANEPDALVADFAEGVAMAQDAKKGLLYGIFSIGGVAQDGESHAIEGAGVLVDQRSERSLFRAPAGLVVHRARGNFHPTRVNGLAGAHS